MIRIELEEKSFGAARVLGEIRLEIGDTEAVALTGPSGIGKSTLLRLIAGLDREFEGTITGVGRLAMVFQEPTLMPWRSVLDNVALAADVTQANARVLLDEAGLAEKSALFPGQLSLGQRRRVAIVRAFATRPETLLMDEPFASLDQASAEAMRGLLRQLLAARPTRMILVTHDPADAERLADRVVRLGGVPATVQEITA